MQRVDEDGCEVRSLGCLDGGRVDGFHRGYARGHARCYQEPAHSPWVKVGGGQAPEVPSQSNYRREIQTL